MRSTGSWFLDKTDDYVSRELEDSVDEHPMDDEELEPSLGWTDMESRTGVAVGTPEDTELDDCDDEAEPRISRTSVRC
jgi:hypothetical protein